MILPIGWKSGVATNIERACGIILLLLACRHHILELILEASFHAVMGPSKSPEICLFKNFQKQWKTTNQEGYELPECHPSVLNCDRRAPLIKSAENHISVSIQMVSRFYFAPNRIFVSLIYLFVLVDWSASE